MNSPSQTQVLAAELFQMSRHDSEDHNSASISESTPTEVQLVLLGGTVGLAAAQGYVIFSVSTISRAHFPIPRPFSDLLGIKKVTKRPAHMPVAMEAQ
jgi:hypothetical protein